jgi:ribonuclease R
MGARSGAEPRPVGGELRDPHAAREAARYEQPIASRQMILQLLAAADGPMDADALAGKLALTEPDRFDALNKRLGAMLRDGQLLQNRRGAWI